MLSPNTILRERYRIIHQLGHGGMGAVYQAMDENLSCVVAVKETFAVSDEQRRAFRREAELLANLSHPTLPRVMDHFTHGDGQFLVMQFVPGHDLAELLDLREQPFSVAKVLDWADQLLDALEELHSSNPPIIHRDIKPANLKVTPRGRILLLDFGLAKGIAGQMSTAEVDSHGRSIYGYTPNYAPLEQIRNAGTDQRSDLYSLAATLWTLLTGKVPPDALARVGEKEDGNPDPLRLAHEINPDVPVAVSTILGQAMALNRNQRHASAIEMRQALRHAREAEFDVPTLRKPEPGAPPPTELRKAAPGSTIRPPDNQLPQQKPGEPHMPTIRVDSPPAVPSWGGAPTVNSVAVETGSHARTSKRIALAIAAILVAAGAIALIAWQPWKGSEEAGKNDQTQASNSTASASNLSVANKAPSGMAYVPGGTFMMGRDDGDEYERPAHSVTVKPFLMDINEVTRELYREFVSRSGHAAPVNGAGKRFPSGTAKWPVTDVTWDDANAYCKWAAKRLPTEEEWEFAARGTDNRRYPWGSVWQAGNANADDASKSFAEVGSYKGTSPYGETDMVGNAWEWTATKLAAYPGGELSKPVTGDMRIIRGGSYAESRDEATTTYRRGYPARGNYDYANTGFRCAKDVLQ
ncbi:MAG TPA: bifunctional serine/threonine-protein kinase/formylglycine-generating enzyme family protein [Pyrinomonadaceae bacterium]